MKLTSKQVTMFLFASEGIGAIFAGIFIAAYMLGLPSTAVLHSEPAFRVALSGFGIIFVALLLVALLLSFLAKKTKE